MSRFVQRDVDGKLTGHYANAQPGIAEEEVADDHPDILDWQAERRAYRLADHNSQSNERLRVAEERLRQTEQNIEVIRGQLAELITKSRQ